jgi:hypothetical protein
VQDVSPRTVVAELIAILSRLCLLDNRRCPELCRDTTTEAVYPETKEQRCWKHKLATLIP